VQKSAVAVHRGSMRDSGPPMVQLSAMSPITIATLKELAGEKPLLAAVHAQLQARTNRVTKNGKPYLELTFADSTGHFPLKVWSDSPVYKTSDALETDRVFRLEGRWSQNKFGIEVEDVRFHDPDEQALEIFFAGNPAILEKQDADFAQIVDFCRSVSDPRLQALCGLFLDQWGERFRRTAAAKRNHHARRGGLVEHVAQMMRCGNAVCTVYQDLNRDLILTGILFHDCGKLWENTYPERGFAQIHGFHGEMLGHIPLGIELVNKLWRDLMDTPDADAWAAIAPPHEDVRIHLLHLIASHHGEYEYGSPVLPRTPEAFALHYIDNLDAKLEMVRDAYANSQEISHRIFDRVFPLPTNLVLPLAAFVAPTENPENKDVPDGSTSE
jgi:3'-5' exoribonuclease